MAQPNLKAKIKLLLRNIDLFGVEPKLQMKNSSKYNSVLGGFVSIFFYLITFLSILYFGQEIVFKEVPYDVKIQQYDKDPRRYNLTMNKFNFFVGVGDSNFNFYKDASIYTLSGEFEVIHNLIDKSGNLNRTSVLIPLRFEDCNIEKHFSNFRTLFVDIDLSRYSCLIPEDMEKLYLIGSNGNLVYSRVNFYVSSCQNVTGNCRSQDVLTSYLKSAYFKINFVDTIFDPRKYDHPESYISRDIYSTMSTTYSKSLNLYFNNVDMVTDSGIVLESFDMKSYLKLEKKEENLEIGKKEPFFKSSLMLSNIREVVQRKYMKAQDFISHIGGLVKGIITVLEFLLMTYTNTKYFTFLINESYTFTTENQENGAQTRNMSKMNKSMSIIENNFLKKSSTMETLKNFQKSKKKLQMSLCQTLNFAFCKRCHPTSQSRLFLEGKDKIRDNINIIRVIKLCDEMELLKNILFDYKERPLIEFLNENRRLESVAIRQTDVDEVVENYSTISHFDNKPVMSNLKSVIDMRFGFVTGNTSHLN
jgi:hypothetical protein